MGIRVRLCSDWCLREADGESDYPQTAVSCIVRTQYPYFAQAVCRDYRLRTYIGIALKFLFQFFSGVRHFRSSAGICRWSSILNRPPAGGPVVVWMGGEPVTGELLVEGWYGGQPRSLLPARNGSCRGQHSSPITILPFSSRPNSNLVSAMMIPWL